MTSTGELRIELNVKALSDYLVEHVPGLSLPISVSQFEYGQSNPTFMLEDAGGTKYVLRRRPPGKLIASAHNVAREYRVMRALKEHTSVPVPKVYCFCKDDSVIGSEFYLMEFLKGRIFADSELPEVESQTERFAIWEASVKALARLHSVDYAAIGLADFAPPGEYYLRQTKSLSRISKSQADIVDAIPGIESLVEYYERNAPRGERGITHGDYKLDNLIFHPSEARVIGIIDWELCTLGHPFADLATLLNIHATPKIDGLAPAGASRGLKDVPKSEFRIPTRDQLLRSYCREARRPFPLKRFEVAESFCWFRLAVIFQGIAARYASGQASSKRARESGGMYKIMGEVARRTVEDSARAAKM